MMQEPRGPLEYAQDAGAAGSFGGDTHEVAGVQVEGNDVRILNPELLESWVKAGVKLSELPEKLKGSKVPDGYRLPTMAEIAKLRADRQDKFAKITAATGIADGQFNFLMDDGAGPARSEEKWSADGASFDKGHQGSNEREERKLRLDDMILLVRAESNHGANS